MIAWMGVRASWHVVLTIASVACARSVSKLKRILAAMARRCSERHLPSTIQSPDPKAEMHRVAEIVAVKMEKRMEWSGAPVPAAIIFDERYAIRAIDQTATVMIEQAQTRKTFSERRAILTLGPCNTPSGRRPDQGRRTRNRV